MRFFSLPGSSLTAPLRTRNIILVSGIFSCLYLTVQSLLLNTALVQTTLLGGFPISYKLHLIFSLVTGYFYMFPPKELAFSLVAAVLVGVNFALLIALMQNVKRSGDMKMSFGGAGVLALASTGCPSCGLTLLSFLGPSTGMIAVALHNPLAQIGILSILFLSVFLSLRRLQASSICKR